MGALPSAGGPGKPAVTPKPSKQAPRAYVTKQELAACSSYMVGRLTVDKVNAALEDFARACPLCAALPHVQKAMQVLQHSRGGSAHGCQQRAADFADENHKMMAVYRRKPGALGPADRSKALDASRVIAANATMKAAFWFLETDLKNGAAVKMDNTGKSLLQLLRHLKRFSEVRSPQQYYVAHTNGNILGEHLL